MPFLHQIDPIALHIGSGGIHWYGITYLLSFAAAWWLGRRRVRAGRLPGVDDNAYGDLMFYAMLGVVLGGRVGYILFYDLRTYVADPLQVFRIWEGGMSFHGGLLGVFVALWLWARKQKLHVFDVADFMAPLAAPGLGLGRLGNFINGELWGKPTDGSWGVIFPQAPEVLKLRLDLAALRAQFEAGALNMYARQPSQLYQFALEGVAMFAILWWYSRKPRPRYAVAGWFAVLYGVFRFAVEFVRVPDPQIGYIAFGWLTMGQVLGLPVVVFGLACLWKSRSAPTLQPQPQPASTAPA